MIKKSLVQSALYNLLKTINGIIFPIITLTYAAHILGVTGVGQVNFTKSFTTYFTMIAMLGVNYYGTREAARIRDDKEALSRFCMEILLINAVTTIFAYLLLGLAIVNVPKLQSYKELLLVNSTAILLCGMGMEWLYQALEEYRYIAVRSTIFQGIALVAMFVFVRQPSDTVSYAIIAVIASSGSYILNFINARKYICLRWDSNCTIKRHIKPLLLLFAMNVSLEIYTVLDSTMLAFLKGDTAVGLYSMAIKIEKSVNVLIAALGMVIIPRLAYYIGKKDHERANQLIQKAYNYAFMLSIPAAVGLFVLSNDIIALLGGVEFLSAALTMQILAPIVVFIPFSMITNSQIFIPMRKDKLILYSTCTGAIIDLVLNMLLIPRYGENGAAAATVIAEIAVAIVSFCNIRNVLSMGTVFSRYYEYWLAVLPIPFVFGAVRILSLTSLSQIVSVIIFSAIIYACLLSRVKNPYYIELWKIVKQRLLKLEAGF